MAYPTIPPFTGSDRDLVPRLVLAAQLKHEYGAKGIMPILRRAEKALERAVREMRRLPVDKTLAKKEPDDLDAIRRLRPRGPRRIWRAVDRKTYPGRLAGALLGRMAGCTLGAPVEFWPVEKMEALAAELGIAFPPAGYWPYVPEPAGLRYGLSRRDAYTARKMDGVPVDDDIAYTILGLLVMEAAGPGFSVDDVGRAWVAHLPIAYTAEEVALRNLKKGVPAGKAGGVDNPFCEMIGADIRADPWGYMAPGWPERAADLAWRDARLSHRRQGVYGEMYFAAAIAAAFTTDDPVEALRLGLTEIPADCALAKALRWALSVAPRIRDHKQARAAMDARFRGMHPVHTINNACLTVWGVTIGGRDFSKVISETVAMGMDNDCTAATAGSIVGAVVGKKGIPARWHRPFRNTVRTYFHGNPVFRIDDLLRRFARQAARVHDGG